MDKQKFCRFPQDTSQQEQFVEEAIEAINKNEQDIQKAASASGIPVLTEDNAAEIYKQAPRMIVYAGDVYTLADDATEEGILNYSFIRDNLSCYIEVYESGSIDGASTVLAKKADAGTKLYKHTFSDSNHQTRLVLYKTNNTPVNLSSSNEINNGLISMHVYDSNGSSHPCLGVFSNMPNVQGVYVYYTGSYTIVAGPTFSYDSQDVVTPL